MSAIVDNKHIYSSTPEVDADEFNLGELL
ncbi:protein of unknown function, partial [uncultured Woeseiaceae bacterium]